MGGGGGDHGHGHGDGGGDGKKYKVPEAYKYEHEHRGYAEKLMARPEKQPTPFWHPPPKDMPEAPVHFGKNPINLELHLGDPRQRLEGMTDAERAWRKKFVMAQRLHPEEPIYVPEFQGNFNPFRRIYRLPWDTLERRVLIPSLGYFWGHYIRVMVPKAMMIGVGVIWAFSYVKYHHPTWVDTKRVRAYREDAPFLHEKEIREEDPALLEKGLRVYKDKQDWWDLDFKHRYSHLTLDPPARP